MGVKKVSTKVSQPRSGSSFVSGPQAEGQAERCSEARQRPQTNGDEMGVLVYIVLTVAIFALLGLVQKLVEGL